MTNTKSLFEHNKDNKESLAGFAKNCRLIALDLDHTTLKNDGSLPQGMAALISGLSEKGIHVIAASGRPFAALPEEIRNHPCIRYAITSNGASLCQNHPYECIREFFLPETAVNQLAARYLPHYPLEVFIAGKGYSPVEYVEDPCRFGAPENIISYVQTMRTPVKDMANFIAQHITEIQSLDIIVPDRETNHRLRREIEALRPVIHLTSSADHLLELSNEASGKEQRLADLAALLEIPLSSCLAFGDGENDADMLRDAGIGIAMGDACDIAKNAADFLTLTNEEEGVPAALRYIFTLSSRY